MLWGGRFKDKLDKAALEFSSSLSFDINLIYEDLLVSRAHANMLAKVGLISREEADKIIEGLSLVESLYRDGTWKPEEEEYEDVHSAIEDKLFDLIGTAAGKLHTGRSRNDQAATDLRLRVKSSVDSLAVLITEVQKIFLDTAEQHINTLIPAYTHLQRAQPVSFAFHLLAYVNMLERDKKRLGFAYAEADVCPLGSGAVAGSTLPLDRKAVAEELGFPAVSLNAMDSVSDRDFLLSFLNCCVNGMIHLSRLCEELVLWSTAEWGFITLSDKYTTGSSLMPQKKNPDIAELIRGKAGRVFGNYSTLVMVLKGIPLSYNRDLQEDKEPFFDSFKTWYNSLLLTGEMIKTMEVNKDRFVNEMKGDFSLATDIADWLVMQNIPFRTAHKITGELVKYCEENNKKFHQLTVEEIKLISPAFTGDVLEIMDVSNATGRKKTAGSPNPLQVQNEIKRWRLSL